MSDFTGYVMQAGELIPLLPLIVLTGASVWVMMAIGVRRHYRFALASTVIGLLLAGLLAHHLMAGPDPAPTPLLTMDGYAQFFTVLICALAIGVSLLAHNYWSEFDDQREEFFLLLLLATLGAVVLVGANHFASLLLGLETLSMSLYGMLAYPVQSRRQSGERPLEATVKYLILSAVSTAMILFGVALIYAETGSLFFAGLADLPAGPGLGQGPGPGIAYSVIALLLLAAGIAFKLSLFPFHIWTPDVYEGAPAPATAFLATIGKIAVAVVLLRLVVETRALGIAPVVIVFSLLALLSIIAGNLLALLQDNLKRILAYSSIAHMGYLLIAIIGSFYAVGPVSVEAVTFYLVAYAVMTLGAFGVVTLLSSDSEEFDHIAGYQGLFWRRPWLAAAFTGMLLSLAGIPLTVGFIGKFYLVLAGVESGLWLLLAALVIGSGIGLYYYLRIVYRMLLPAPEDAPPLREGSAGFGVVMALFALLLVFGVYPASLMTLIEAIAL